MRHSSHFLLAFVAASCCAATWAQAPAPTPVGTVAEVHGLVTMSFGANVATVQPDTPVFDGARFVASSSGGAEIKFKDGCVVKLLPNQWISIDSKDDCDTRIAAVRTLSETVAGGSRFPLRDMIPLLGSTALAGAIARLPDPQITPTPR
jgi:hypothetical protein